MKPQQPSDASCRTAAPIVNNSMKVVTLSSARQAKERVGNSPVVNENVDLLADQLSQFTEDRSSKADWDMKSRCADQTPAAYVARLVGRALALGWEDQTTWDLIIKWRKEHGFDFERSPDYYERAIATARTRIERQRLLSAVNPNTREAALEQLSELLTVKVASIQQFATDPRTYVMRLGNDSYIEFKGNSDLLSQKHLSGALIDYAKTVMPTFKNDEWSRVKQLMIGFCVEDVECSAEATHLGATVSHLRTYLRRQLRPETEREGQLRNALEGRPAKFDDTIWFSMHGLRRSIQLESSEYPPTTELLSVRLRQIGCTYKSKKDFRLSGEPNKSRSLWIAPKDFMSDAELGGMS